MALSWRLLATARQIEKSRSSICRFLSIGSVHFGKVVPFKLADIGEGTRDVVIKEWYVKPGDRVSQFDDICEVQSDKAVVSISSPYDGIIKNLHFKIDDVALVGQTLYDIEVEDEEEDASKIESSDQVMNNESNEEKIPTTDDMRFAEADNYVDDPRKIILATPAVRKIARENNVNLADVKSTGKKGRVLKEDLLAHLQKVSASSQIEEGLATRTSVTSRKIELKGYSRSMWKTMTKSLSIPHFVYSDECNVDQVMLCRSKVKDSLKERNVVITLMPFFVKAASRALEQFPELNAWLDEETRTLRAVDNHNIGIAMDTAQGLVVPNIKNVQNLNVYAIAKELNRLQELGRRTSLSLDDLSDTTFTLSNIGVIGGTYMKPVILSPQVIIGALGRARKLPQFDNKGNVVPMNMMSISWSADHRVLDGVTVAKFSNLWKYYVENPVHLLIGA